MFKKNDVVICTVPIGILIKNNEYKIYDVDERNSMVKLYNYEEYFIFDRFTLKPKLLKIKKGINMPEKAKKVLCEIKFFRDGGKQLLFIKSTPEVTNLFKSDDGVSTSENYLDKDGNKLKYQKETNKLEQYTNKFRTQSGSVRAILNRYGTNLMVEGYYNFSLLRTVGIEDGVTVVVGDLILEDEVTNWIQALGSFIKFLNNSYIAKVEIHAQILIDM